MQVARGQNRRQVIANSAVGAGFMQSEPNARECSPQVGVYYRSVDRRAALKALAVGTGSLMLPGCAEKRVRAAAGPSAFPQQRLAKVLVSADREIRTTVCLRPFRAPGFRLAAEKLGDKLCVHNYGHGGAGITLSWGTAQLAVEQLANTGHTRVAVLGCGVVGLATARLLQQTGKDVTIYAKALPPETTSNSAGGLWLPYSVFDRDRQTPEFQQQFPRAVRFSYSYFQQFAGEDYGLHWLPIYLAAGQPIPETEMMGPKGPFPDLLPDLHDWQPGEHPFPHSYVRQFRAMLIEPPTYLRALLRDFRLAGGKVVLREFHDPGDVSALSEPALVNCTGLGARALFSDQELIPIKGQLTCLLPQPEVNYMVISGDLYMFPRRDGIVLGGTHVRGDWSLEPDLEAKSRVLAGHAELFGRM
jgi:D-amino-acid oxidase